MKQQNLLWGEKATARTSPLQFLDLETNSDDAERVRRALLAEWPDGQLLTVGQKACFMAGLPSGKFDLILADYCLPSSGGLKALALAKSLRGELTGQLSPKPWKEGTIEN